MLRKSRATWPTFRFGACRSSIVTSVWSAFSRSATSPAGTARTLAKRCAEFRGRAESTPRRADIARLTPMLDLAHPRDRNRMVDVQIARRGVRDQHVLDAMRDVPREAFVEPGFEEFAYEDGPLPIGEGQTISQPYIVALMIEAAELKPGDRVLEVGAGSGYAAAVMGQIVDCVYTIERHPALGESGQQRFK